MWKIKYYFKILLNSTRKDGFTNTIKKLVTKYQFGPTKKYTVEFSHFLNEINYSKKIALVFSVVLYEKQMNQRSVNCAKYLAAAGYTVFFIPWQWTPNHILQDAFKLVDERIYCVPLYSLEIDKLSNYVELMAIYTLAAMFTNQIAYSLKQLSAKIYYDIYDDWEEFEQVGMADWYCGPAQEQQLIQMADVVSVVSPVLKHKFVQYRPDIVLSPNGFDLATVGSANFEIVSAPQQMIVIGYFGHLTAKWINWEFIFYLAKLPQVKVEIIGNGILDGLARQFREHNIKYWGVVPAAELYTYVQNWHFGLVPFKYNKLSAAVDPIKIYEYLYYGLTSLVTGVSHVATYPNTLVIDEAEQFELTRQQLLKNFKQANTQAVRNFLAKNTWQQQFAKIFLS